MAGDADALPALTADAAGPPAASVISGHEGEHGEEEGEPEHGNHASLYTRHAPGDITRGMAYRSLYSQVPVAVLRTEDDSVQPTVSSLLVGSRNPDRRVKFPS